MKTGCCVLLSVCVFERERKTEGKRNSVRLLIMFQCILESKVKPQLSIILLLCALYVCVVVCIHGHVNVCF